MSSTQSVKLRNSLIITFILTFIGFQIFTFFGQGIVVRFVVDKMAYQTQEKHLIVMADSLEDAFRLEVSAVNEIIFANSLNTVFQEGLRSNDYFNIDSLLKKIQHQDKNLDDIFLADRNGTVISSTATNFLRESISDREYFKETVGENREHYITKTALKSRSNGNPVLVFSSPIRYKGQVLGMLGATLNLGNIENEIILSKEIGKTGFAYVIDESNQLIMHPDPELILTDVSGWAFMEDVKNREEEKANFSYEHEGTKYEAAFARVEGLDWLLIVAMEDKEVASTASTTRMAILLANIVFSLLMMLSIFFLVRGRIVRRLSPLESMMGQAADGVLTDRLKVSGKDELASVSRSYNSLIDSLGAFFNGLHQRMTDMESGGNDLAANMEQTAAAVQQIKANVGSSMKQVRSQEDSVSSTVTAVEEMTRNIESQDKSIDRQNNSIVESSSAVEELIAQVQSIAASSEEAEKYMMILVRSAETGQNRIHNVADLVSTISNKSHDLEEANTLISGIAARTNLLAMNAAIEAAHAGDAGRGFAVVADEIRKLAEQSTVQSKQVKESIVEINRFIQDVVEGSQISGQSFDDIQQNIDQMGRITGEIRSSIEEQASGGNMVLNSLKEMREIASGVIDGSKEMTQGNQVILEAVNSLRDVNHQLNHAMREIASGIDEINQSVLNVSELTEQNKKSIERVRENASRYKV
jgi:methyl-accepting chemotaxis protein